MRFFNQLVVNNISVPAGSPKAEPVRRQGLGGNQGTKASLFHICNLKATGRGFAIPVAAKEILGRRSFSEGDLSVAIALAKEMQTFFYHRPKSVLS